MNLEQIDSIDSRRNLMNVIDIRIREFLGFANERTGDFKVPILKFTIENTLREEIRHQES